MFVYVLLVYVMLRYNSSLGWIRLHNILVSFAIFGLFKLIMTPMQKSKLQL